MSLTTECEFRGWERLQFFASQAEAKYEFVLVTDAGVDRMELRATREIGMSSYPDRQGYAMDSAFTSCIIELVRQVCEQFPSGGKLRFATPTEFSWCVQQQFVEEPLRFFLERDAYANWYLNMATEVEMSEEDAQ